MTDNERLARGEAFMACVDKLRYGYDSAAEYARALLEIAIILELDSRMDVWGDDLD